MNPIISINELGAYDGSYEVKFISLNGQLNICNVTAQREIESARNGKDVLINVIRVVEGNSAMNWSEGDISIFRHYLERKDIPLYYHPGKDETAIQFYPN